MEQVPSSNNIEDLYANFCHCSTDIGDHNIEFEDLQHGSLYASDLRAQIGLPRSIRSKSLQ